MSTTIYATNSLRLFTSQIRRSVPVLIRVGEKEKRPEDDRDYGVLKQDKLQINIIIAFEAV